MNKIRIILRAIFYCFVDPFSLSWVELAPGRLGLVCGFPRALLPGNIFTGTLITTYSRGKLGPATSNFGGAFRSCWGGGGMTALAGSIPRMMRPTLAQNYPRGGFPLEGNASDLKRRGNCLTLYLTISSMLILFFLLLCNL